MFYEEMIKDEQTYFRTSPNGKWTSKSNQAFTRQVKDLKDREF